MPTRDHVLLLGHDRLFTPVLSIHSGVLRTISATPYGYRRPAVVLPKMGYVGQFCEGSQQRYMLGNGYRAYSPELMRFHSADKLSPFGRGGLNAYVYCSADPVNRVDRDGHAWNILSTSGLVTGATFEIANFNAIASGIVEKSINPATFAEPSVLQRVANVATTYGTVAGMVADGTGLLTANAFNLGATAGLVKANVYTMGHLPQATAMGFGWVGTARANGISLLNVAGRALEEMSGLRLLQGKSLATVATNVASELQGVVVESTSLGPQAAATQMRRNSV